MASPPQIVYTAYDGSEVDSDTLKLKIHKKKIGSANDIAKLAAPKATQLVYNALRVGPRLILRSAFELLRANMVTRVISVVVLLAIDKFSLIRGKISFKQFIINVTLALMLLVGGTAGWMLGSHVLSLIIESIVLGIIAGIVGAGILSAILTLIVNKIIHLFTTDDTQDMIGIYCKEFEALAKEHRLNNDEIICIKDSLCMCKQHVQDIFVQKDKPNFACETLAPYVTEQVELRGEPEIGL